MDIEKRPGLVRAGAYVIVDMEDRKGGLNGIAGKILFLYRKDGAGILYVNMWDFVGNRDVQEGKASGFGYDKESTGNQRDEVRRAGARVCSGLPRSRYGHSLRSVCGTRVLTRAGGLNGTSQDCADDRGSFSRRGRGSSS